jgi:protein-lysine N-methyltransferase EEF2KMT
MEDLSFSCQRELNLFRRRYLQLQVGVYYPETKCLRQETFQQALFNEVFAESATEFHPPQRYRLRILKELFHRIETSISNWEEEVCTFRYFVDL